MVFFGFTYERFLFVCLINVVEEVRLVQPEGLATKVASET